MSSTNINAWPYAFTSMIIYHLCFNLVLSDPRVCCFWKITLQSIYSRDKNSLWAMYSITSEHLSQKHAGISDLQWVKNWTFLEVNGWHVINLAIPPSPPQTKTFHSAVQWTLFGGLSQPHDWKFGTTPVWLQADVELVSYLGGKPTYQNLLFWYFQSFLMCYN